MHGLDFVDDKKWCRGVEGGYTHCYKLADNVLYNYGGAQAQCFAEGGYLARINSRQEFEFVKRALAKGIY